MCAFKKNDRYFSPARLFWNQFTHHLKILVDESIVGFFFFLILIFFFLSI